MSDPIRVAQWATGAIGKTALRGIIDRPDLELVGLYVYSDAKAGRDAGDIARRAPTGVIATRDVDEIIARAHRFSSTVRGCRFRTNATTTICAVCFAPGST